MPCLTRLYEPTGATPPGHMDLTAGTVELVAIDQATRANCCGVQTNKQFTTGSGYGANLPFPAASIVYQVTIIDTARVYGGARIPNLNGDVAGDLDVVLYKMPATISAGGTAAPAGGTATQVRAAILAFMAWSGTEKVAIFGVMDALSSLRGAPSGTIMHDYVVQYEDTLRARGINPTLF